MLNKQLWKKNVADHGRNRWTARDRCPGNVQILVRFQKAKMAPIICTCNEIHLSVLKPLAPLTQRINFHKLFDSDMMKIARKLCRRPYKQSVLESYIQRANGDVRQLQLLCSGWNTQVSNRSPYLMWFDGYFRKKH